MWLARNFPYVSSLLWERLRTDRFSLAATVGVMILSARLIVPDYEQTRFIGAFVLFGFLVSLGGVQRTASEWKRGRLEDIYWSILGHRQTLIAVLLGLNAIEWAIAAVILICLPVNLWFCYCCVMCIAAFGILLNAIWTLHADPESGFFFAFWLSSPALLWAMERYSGPEAVPIAWGAAGVLFFLLNTMILSMNSTTAARLLSREAMSLASVFVPPVLLIIARNDDRFEFNTSAGHLASLYFAHLTLLRMGGGWSRAAIMLAFPAAFALTWVSLHPLHQTSIHTSTQASHCIFVAMFGLFITIRGVALIAAWHLCLPTYVAKETLLFVGAIVMTELGCFVFQLAPVNSQFLLLATTPAGYVMDSFAISPPFMCATVIFAYTIVLAAVCLLNRFEWQTQRRVDSRGWDNQGSSWTTKMMAEFPLLWAIGKERCYIYREARHRYNLVFNVCVSIGIVLCAMPGGISLSESLPAWRGEASIQQRIMTLVSGLLFVSWLVIAWVSISTFWRDFKRGVVSEWIRIGMSSFKIISAYLLGPAAECVLVAGILFTLLFGYSATLGTFSGMMWISLLAGMVAVAIQLFGLTITCVWFASVQWKVKYLLVLVTLCLILAASTILDSDVVRIIQELRASQEAGEFLADHVTGLMVLVLSIYVGLPLIIASGMKDCSDFGGSCDVVSL